MHTDMTAVTIQSNKIVLNEVKDNQVLLDSSYKEKTNKLFGQALGCVWATLSNNVYLA